MAYTIRITSNRKRYPTKYIQLIKRIQDKSMDIYEFIFDANRLDLNTEKEKRTKLQTKAISSCDKLSCFIEMSKYPDNHIKVYRCKKCRYEKRYKAQ